eukprot:851892-Rhodomonas_salina.2
MGSVQPSAEKAWLEWMGPDFEAAHNARPVAQKWEYLQKGDCTVKSRRRNCKLEVGILPLEDIANFLEAVAWARGKADTLGSWQKTQNHDGHLRPPLTS